MGATLAGGCTAETIEAGEVGEHGEDITQVVCSQYTACDCSEDVTDEASCMEVNLPKVERSLSEAGLLDLRYNGKCEEKFREHVASVGCGAELGETFESTQDELLRCKLISGQSNLGQPCTIPGGLDEVVWFWVGDSCEQGSVCAPTGGQGGPACIKIPDQDEQCSPEFEICPGGQRCLDPDADGVSNCTAIAGEGGICNPHDGLRGCDGDLVCDVSTRICISLPLDGELCTAQGECASGHLCDAGTCLKLPGQGEECVAGGLCGPNLVCGTEDLCITAPTEGEECHNGFFCGQGLACNDGTCTKEVLFCAVADAYDECIYAGDGICDEPEGTGFCPVGSDSGDCYCGTLLGEIENKYAECNVPGPETMCTSVNAEQIACQAACLALEPCGALDGTDPEAAADLAECLGDCFDGGTGTDTGTSTDPGTGP